MDLREIKGVGEKTYRLLNKLKLYTTEDLLHNFPRNYDIFEKPIRISQIDNKAVVSIDGRVARNLDVKHIKNLTICATSIQDEDGNLIKVIWYNMPFLRSTLKYGMRFVFRGRIKRTEHSMTLEQPQMYTLEQYDKKVNEMQPIYPLVKGITSNQLSKFVKETLKGYEEQDYLTADMRHQYDLISKSEAICDIHFPKNMEVLKDARKRLAFDEFFTFIYKMTKLKENEIKIPNQYIIDNHQISDEVISFLQFDLTNAQKRVLEDIRRDMGGETVMQRLVQGDVGSGKTIVAFLAMFDVVSAGLQAVLMVPTEVLAKQHYEDMEEIIKKNHLPYKVSYLTGSLTAKAKREIYADIESGATNIVIGTHAVFQDKVHYDRLGLVVIDEQHRFGVLQRSKLMEKGIMPHSIIMSATPIPRTLAIILYGDMDISIIDELPAKRLAIKNAVVTKSYRPNAYRFITKQVQEGRQAYVICPMALESDMLEAENVIDYAEMLKTQLPPDITVEYLHGKLSAQEKNEILERFEKNVTNVLVSTTVVEVGINVPNATVMMVENAERFSLASLHQLRGRVGRGKYQSYCIFVSSSDKEEKLKRLEILRESNDGFHIASEDLKLRGPGDFFGVRQSGEMQFKMADVLEDGELLQNAKQAVEDFIASGYEFSDGSIDEDILIF